MNYGIFHHVINLSSSRTISRLIALCYSEMDCNLLDYAIVEWISILLHYAIVEWIIILLHYAMVEWIIICCIMLWWNGL
jgi:hypothetical protein